MQPVLESAQMILRDIATKTGRSFRQIAAIDTQVKEVADVVLPVLRDWVPFIEDGNVRDAIYIRFATPHANPYLENMLSWLLSEKRDNTSAFLAQSLVKAMTVAEAERVWDVTSALPRGGFARPFLLVKLATLRPTSERAIECLVRDLQEGMYATEVLEYVARIKDPRIVAWFASRTNDEHPVTRLVARRVVNKKRGLPQGLERVAAGPDPQTVLFSTETDAEDLPKWLQELGQKYDFVPPTPLGADDFTTHLAENTWYRISLGKAGGKYLNLFVRLEDIDIVEFALTA